MLENQPALRTVQTRSASSAKLVDYMGKQTSIITALANSAAVRLSRGATRATERSSDTKEISAIQTLVSGAQAEASERATFYSVVQKTVHTYVAETQSSDAVSTGIRNAPASTVIIAKSFKHRVEKGFLYNA